ncbi:MAG: hypothetical protein LUF34_04145 [Lachnospiraceae bacterium]|nr:hypothetical protein [Lachnospiraceae bacterium]
MKKLAIIVPTQLDEAGALSIRHFRELRQMCEQLAGEYAISLTLRASREKACPGLSDLSVSLIYDREAPAEREIEPAERTRSRFQIQYQRWAKRNIRIGQTVDSVYDCLLVWDGCSPWCLATALECVRARRRILWLQDDPSLYLLSSDHIFYMNLCRRFDASIASEERVQRGFLSLVERELFYHIACPSDRCSLVLGAVGWCV